MDNYNPKEVGKKGGKAVLKKYGKKHYVKMGQMRWKKIVKVPLVDQCRENNYK